MVSRHHHIARGQTGPYWPQGQQSSDPLFDLLRPERLTAIVDIGANPIDGDPPYKAMLTAGLCSVIGFEPQADALAMLSDKKGPHEHYLPYAVGDGRSGSLHISRRPGWTSLLSLDPVHLGIFNSFSQFGRAEKETQIVTHRLDDIEEIETIDLLKIDIQGGELDVFESGRRKLANAVFVQTEVSFVTLYQNQPAFGVIDTCLREMGFLPHCFAELKLRSIAPMVIDGNPHKPVRQLLEADVVYVRDFSRPENMNSEQWKHVAMIAHHCYGSVDLALRAIAAASQTNALPRDACDQYLKILQSGGVRIIRPFELT